MKLVDTPEKKGLDLKSRSELEISYMKMEERDRLLEEKGKRIGRIEGEKAGRIQGERNRLISQVQKKLAKNQSPAEIADALEEDENVILALIANTAQRSCARYQPTATFWGCRTKCIHCLVRQPLHFCYPTRSRNFCASFSLFTLAISAPRLRSFSSKSSYPR